MKIFVKAKTGAKISKIVQKDPLRFEVWVKEKPEGGNANEAIREALSEYFDCPQSKITLLKGGGSRNKIFGIEASIKDCYSGNTHDRAIKTRSCGGSYCRGKNPH